MSVTPTGPRCDMERDCDEPVTHIDHKGYVYCYAHGQQRKASGIRCRKLTPAEARRIAAGQPLTRY